MERQEFMQFVAALRTYYPRENLLPNKEAIALWYRMLGDLSYPLLCGALDKWVSTNKWSPSIADLRQTAVAISEGEVMDYGEGWQEVTRAIGKYGFYRKDEALASMSPLTREVVKRLGWDTLCLSESPAADRANFRQIWETLAKREHEDRAIAPGIKTMLSGLAGSLALDKPGEKPALESKEGNK